MNNIKRLRMRNDLGLSLDELSRKVEISHSILSLLENEKRPLRQAHITRLSSFFNVSTDYLLGKSEKGISVWYKDDWYDITEKQYEDLKLNGHLTENVRISQGFLTEYEMAMENGGDVNKINTAKYFIYRETDVPLKEIRGKSETFDKLEELLGSLTEDQAKKVLKFIQDYII